MSLECFRIFPTLRPIVHLQYCFRSHPDSSHRCERGGRIRHNRRRDEGCAWDTESAEGNCWLQCACGYSVEESRDCFRGCERYLGGSEPAVLLRKRTNNYGDWRPEHVKVVICKEPSAFFWFDSWDYPSTSVECGSTQIRKPSAEAVGRGTYKGCV